MKISEINGLYVATNDDGFKILIATTSDDAQEIAKEYFADSHLSIEKIIIRPFDNNPNTIFDCDYVITGADNKVEIKRPVLTVEFIDDGYKREAGYTITGNIGYEKLKELIYGCISASYCKSDKDYYDVFEDLLEKYNLEFKREAPKRCDIVQWIDDYLF